MTRRLSSYFAGKFFKAADFPQPKLLVIESVDEEEVGPDREEKLVVWFVDEPRGLVLNRINGETIAAIAGTEDLDLWPGTRVVCYSSDVSFGGRTVPGIRVRPQKNSEGTKRRPSADWGTAEGSGDIPF